MSQIEEGTADPVKYICSCTGSFVESLEPYPPACLAVRLYEHTYHNYYKSYRYQNWHECSRVTQADKEYVKCWPQPQQTNNKDLKVNLKAICKRLYYVFRLTLI